ncbi:MAG: guanylate kinase [Alphaproteobacteria bacterium]|jgi:guanylate kinase|nr:guanylate kinase [Alphaproteobacteria bacterium]
MADRGLMLVLSSPSGAGKTTICRELLQRNTTLKASISATTRPPRPGEVDGKDYFFLSPEKFQEHIDTKALLEYASVFKHNYGTPRQPVDDALNAGYDMLFDIDWQGAQQIKLIARKEMLSIFVLPPSLEELHRRLVGRGQDSQETITYRMSKALEEIGHWADYDYVIINRDLDRSIADVEAILRAEKLRRNRQDGLTDFVRGLRAEIDSHQG